MHQTLSFPKQTNDLKQFMQLQHYTLSHLHFMVIKKPFKKHLNDTQIKVYNFSRVITIKVLLLILSIYRMKLSKE